MSRFFGRAARRRWLGYLPYLGLGLLIVLPLWVMATLLAIRAGMFRLSGTPSSAQTSVFLTFIGGGLATAATVLGALFTWQHNRRERHRLVMDTVIRSLDCLEGESRVVGVLSSIILLSQPRVALRVLAPLWKMGQVDDETATWLIGKVLNPDTALMGTGDGDPIDRATVEEAAVLLREHAASLTNEGERSFSFPGYFKDKWGTEPGLPPDAKAHMLIAMGTMLASRGKDWWGCDGRCPKWPTQVLVQCARSDPDPEIKSAAAVLLTELYSHFPDDFKSSFEDMPEILQSILRDGSETAASGGSGEFVSLAGDIRAKWTPGG
jgi:hypothetical protein